MKSIQKNLLLVVAASFACQASPVHASAERSAARYATPRESTSLARTGPGAVRPNSGTVGVDPSRITPVAGSNGPAQPSRSPSVFRASDGVRNTSR